MPRPVLVACFLCLSLLATPACGEVIMRLNPDGYTRTFQVPQRVPSGASAAAATFCGVDPSDIRTPQAAAEAYASVQRRLTWDPSNVACRQTLVDLGRILGASENAIRTDLGAATPSGSGLFDAPAR